MVSRDFFQVLGVQPAMGRSFTPEDARTGAAPVLLGEPPLLEGIPGSGAGPFEREAADPGEDLFGGGDSAGELRVSGEDGPVAAERTGPGTPSRTSHNYYGVGRLRDGVSLAQAATDLGAIAERIVRQSPEHNDYLMRSAVGGLAAEFADGAGALTALYSAGRGGVSAAGGLRQRGQFPAGAGLQARARAGDTERAGSGPGAAGAAVHGRNLVALRSELRRAC